MILTHKLVLVLVVLLTLGLGLSASAVQVAHSEDYLWGELVTSETGLACNSVVDLENGIYTYNYTLIYTAGVGGIHIFDVENPNKVAFDTTSNVPVGTAPAGTAFTNPNPGTTDWIEWLGGELNVGETRKFSYTSTRAPMEISVWTYVVDGGTSAVGTTLGMGAMVPEPSSFAALLFGAAGLLPLVIKKRK